MKCEPHREKEAAPTQWKTARSFLSSHVLLLVLVLPSRTAITKHLVLMLHHGVRQSERLNPETGGKSHCVSTPFLLLSERNLNPEIQLYPEKSHPATQCLCISTPLDVQPPLMKRCTTGSLTCTMTLVRVLCRQGQNTAFYILTMMVDFPSLCR